MEQARVTRMDEVFRSGRARLLAMADDLGDQEIGSIEEFREVRRRAFASAGDLIDSLGVDEVQSRALAEEHALAVSLRMRERWPAWMSASAR